MRVLSFNDFLNQPDGILFQIVHRGKPPGVLMARGTVTRYDKIARFVAASLSPDEDPTSAAYAWPAKSGAFTFEYDDVEDVRFLVLDRDDVRTLTHLIRVPLDAIHAYEHGHAGVGHPQGWKACHSAMFDHENSRHARSQLVH